MSGGAPRQLFSPLLYPLPGLDCGPFIDSLGGAAIVALLQGLGGGPVLEDDPEEAARLIDDGILPVELEIDEACSGGGERQEDKV